MNKAIIKKRTLAKRRQIRTRAQIKGVSTRPRLTVFRSLKHISAQVIDDVNGKTVAAASDKEVEIKGKKPLEIAAEVGKLVAEKATKAKVKQVVFDRSSYKYHGRVRALAEAARAAGLEF